MCLIVRMGLESRAEGRVKGVKDTNYRGKLRYGKRKEKSSMHSFIVAQSDERFITYACHGQLWATIDNSPAFVYDVRTK